MSRTDKQHGESAPLLSSSQAPSRDYGVRGNEQLERSTNTISGSQDEGQQLATGIEEVPPKDRKKRPATPLPKMQLFVLCLMRMTEPISFTVIFPFVNQMLKDNLPNVPTAQIGYYAGVVESVFAFVQFLTVFMWGRLSDSLGRKPILLTGIVGVFLSVNAFGFAHSFPAMIVARSIAGVMNGNVAVLKSMLGEITDETNQARAFSLIPMCYAIGVIIGPLIGGSLSDPVAKFPELFGNSEFLRQNPYYLPCAVASIFNLMAMLIGFFFLRETLPAKMRRDEAHAQARAAERGSSTPELESSPSGSGTSTPTLTHRVSEGDLHIASLRRAASKAAASRARNGIPSAWRREGTVQNVEERTGGEGHHDAAATAHAPGALVPEEPAKPLPIRELITAQIVSVLTSQMLMNLMNACHMALVPLFCYESIAEGGVSFSKEDIGTLLAAQGVAAIVTQVFIFPRLERSLGGPMHVYRRVTAFLPLSFLSFPLAHYAAANWGRRATWAVFGVQLLFKTTANMGIVCSTLLVNNSAPSRSSLGSLNGLSQSCGSLSRAIGPTAATSLFAFSVTHGAMNGQLVWVVLGVVATLTWLTTFRVRVNKATWRKRAGASSR